MFWQHISCHSFLCRMLLCLKSWVSLCFDVFIISVWGVIADNLRADVCLRWFELSAATRWRHLHFFPIDTPGYACACASKCVRLECKLYVIYFYLTSHRHNTPPTIFHLDPISVLIIHRPWKGTVMTAQDKQQVKNTTSGQWQNPYKIFLLHSSVLRWKHLQ